MATNYFTGSLAFVAVKTLTKASAFCKKAPINFAQILHDHSGGYTALLQQELEEVGLLIIDTATKVQLRGSPGQPTRYTSPAYERLALAAARTASMENEIVDGLGGFKISQTKQEAWDEINQHSTKYLELFDTWRPQRWPLQLREVHSALVPRFPSPGSPVLQPNPWRDEGIEPSSKRYLARLLEVFGGARGVNPLDTVATACAAVAAEFGPAVRLVRGPPKKEQRVMEKARACSYDGVRDYGRLSLITDDAPATPRLVERLGACTEFELVRAKNRLDPDHDAHESAGYRDYQLLVCVAGAVGWVVEIQVIPGEMYTLKSTLGHAGYAKYRFILEACRRAQARTAWAEHPRTVSAAEFAQEIQTMKELQHPHLVKLLGSCVEVEPFMMILEYSCGGSLEDWLPQNGSVPPRGRLNGRGGRWCARGIDVWLLDC